MIGTYEKIEPGVAVGGYIQLPAELVSASRKLLPGISPYNKFRVTL